MTRWRWDQGRLIYFQFENIRKIALSLLPLEGVSLDQTEDPLRQRLEQETGLPFLPRDYKVWRNYKRVFECALLATRVDDRLAVTDICRRIARDDGAEMDADEYLSIVSTHFRYPFPAFDEYDENDPAVYPFCAILKYLLSGFLTNGSASISVDELFSKIIGNSCTGLEPVAHYANLPTTDHTPSGDEGRQAREMLIFISQLSILKWYQGRLFLDVLKKDYEDYNQFRFLIEPRIKEILPNREQDFMSMTSTTGDLPYEFKLASREAPSDEIFVEGKRARVTHIKIERSPMLRRIYLQANPNGICEMCSLNTKTRYPWTENIIEVHHILPLSSALLVTAEGTSLTDVVGICPSCHKSVHSFYRKWLNNNNLQDFRSRDEAKEIYQLAKSSTIAA